VQAGWRTLQRRHRPFPPLPSFSPHWKKPGEIPLFSPLLMPTVGRDSIENGLVLSFLSPSFPPPFSLRGPLPFFFFPSLNGGSPADWLSFFFSHSQRRGLNRLFLRARESMVLGRKSPRSLWQEASPFFFLHAVMNPFPSPSFSPPSATCSSRPSWLSHSWLRQIHSFFFFPLPPPPSFSIYFKMWDSLSCFSFSFPPPFPAA